MLRYIQKFIIYFSSRIRFKIILPYALLTVIVAVFGVYLSTRLLADRLDRQFTAKLVNTGRAVADGLTQREILHTSALRAIVFTSGIGAVINEDNREQLLDLVSGPAAISGINRVDIARFDGHQLLEIRQPEYNKNIVQEGANLVDWSIWPNLDKVLNGIKDSVGDKYVTLEAADDQMLFSTIGPVKQGNEVVGVVIVSSYTSDLLRSLKSLTESEITLYDLEGHLLDTTWPHRAEALTAVTIAPEQTRPLLALEGTYSRRMSVSLGGEQYDLLLAVFLARGEPIGFYSVAQRTTFNEAVIVAGIQMVLIFGLALVFVFGIGYLTANMITNRVQHLQENARAVAEGDLTRRTRIPIGGDEIGSLARSLDDMTEILDIRFKELTALHESSNAINVQAGLQLEAVLSAIMASVKETIQGIDQAVVYLLDEKSQMLIPRASASGQINGWPSFSLTEREGISSLLGNNKPRLINKSEIKIYSDNNFSGKNGTTNLLVAPLIAGQKTVGILTLAPNSTQPQSQLLDEDRERVLGILANQAASAIKNAQAYEDLQQVDRLKTEFINIAAHELRTPLGVLMGSASFVEKRVGNNKRLRDNARILMASTLRMRSMVDAILAVQRLNTGEEFLRIKPLDIQKSINEVIDDYQPMIKLEGHSLKAKFVGELSLIEADREKISLVLSNLVSNAIKFTPENGQIEITAQDDDEAIIISVSDNGVGIAPEDHARIFERYEQIRPSHLAGHGGLGLGLTIVKNLIELHGGKVWLESEVGQGTTFFFTLPKVTPVNPDTTSAPPTNNSRVNEEITHLEAT